MKQKPTVAICYDFDGTLSPKNMQEFGFFHGLPDKERRSFWKESNGLAKKLGADQNLTYMKLMVDKARQPGNDLKATKNAFEEYGKDIKFFKGVENWFSRIKKYGKVKGVNVEHYIISSGLKEMVEGSLIGKAFTKIYACSFLYDKHGLAEWPGQVVNCTSKTQYLFRINKGIEDDSDTVLLNSYVKPEDRPVPFSRIVYIGDGSTDIPCMRLVKDLGGYSIAVYKPRSQEKKTVAEKLYSDKRVNYIAPADYSEGSNLDELLKRIIDRIVSDYHLEKLSRRLNPQAVANQCQPQEEVASGEKPVAGNVAVDFVNTESNTIQVAQINSGEELADDRT